MPDDRLTTETLRAAFRRLPAPAVPDLSLSRQRLAWGRLSATAGALASLASGLASACLCRSLYLDFAAAPAAAAAPANLLGGLLLGLATLAAFVGLVLYAGDCALAWLFPDLYLARNP